MNTIQIVTNHDRCHVVVNDIPAQTFIYCSYEDKTDNAKKSHALHDAQAQCFLQLAKFQTAKQKAQINTEIISK